ncbi:unnamed protein product [Peronospora farinosa]|uniref:Uncharacterized protein n=1 Tax=Peronospora farinosa TaxID=134698 RepID=A0AAV0ULU7_9STRA|nr:unnamed protein product [Peronospora farinosa]
MQLSPRALVQYLRADRGLQTGHQHPRTRTDWLRTALDGYGFALALDLFMRKAVYTEPHHSRTKPADDVTSMGGTDPCTCQHCISNAVQHTLKHGSVPPPSVGYENALYNKVRCRLRCPTHALPP